MSLIYREVEVTSDKLTYGIPEGVMESSDVYVHVDGVEKYQPNDFTVASDLTIITFLTPPPLHSILHIRRSTDATNKKVDFQAGALLTEDSLDTAYSHIFNLAQEAVFSWEDGVVKDFDGKMNAQGRIIGNVQAGVGPLDAVNMQQQGDYLTEVTTKHADVVDKHSQLYNLTTQVDALSAAPLGGASPQSEYDPTTGLLKIWVADGPMGETGATGALGPLGPAGAQGVQGIQGIQGEEGDRGPSGGDGPLGPTGAVGPRGTQGIVGPLGPTGATGPVGPQGVKGDAGNRGPIGIQGTVGLQGPVGDKGDIGPEGPKGIQGTVGLQGPTGSTGSTGSLGPLGPTGPEGPDGPQGPKGSTGSQGSAGPLGLKGPTGNMGSTPMALAFGRFEISPAGELLIEHYGTASSNDFNINSNGDLEVTV